MHARFCRRKAFPGRYLWFGRHALWHLSYATPFGVSQGADVLFNIQGTVSRHACTPIPRPRGVGKGRLEKVNRVTSIAAFYDNCIVMQIFPEVCAEPLHQLPARASGYTRLLSATPRGCPSAGLSFSGGLHPASPHEACRVFTSEGGGGGGQ